MKSPGRKLRIVYMGTPELAAWILDLLIKEAYHIVGVVTAPDKPAGRGQKLQASPVKQTAIQAGIPVLQPEKFRNEDFLHALKALKADVQVVVAFRMLPEVVWSMPPLGTFNMHASLLPDYRGAAPINHAIIQGETQTGVTTFLLDHEIDTGRILMREFIQIEPGETAGSLHEKMKPAGASIIMRSIEALASGQLIPTEQSSLIRDASRLKTAPRIFREDCRINWNLPAQQIVNLIHGLSPQPGAFSDFLMPAGNTLTIKFFNARARQIAHGFPPGQLFTDQRSYLAISTPDGLVMAGQLQLPGKKRMAPDELLRGYHFDQFKPFIGSENQA